MRLMIVWSRAKEWVEQRFPIDEDCRLSTESETVEFVGGPLDGYEHCVDSVHLYHLPVDLTVPVNRESIRQLDPCSLHATPETGIGTRSDSVVFYHLVQKGPCWQYHFESQRAGRPNESA